MSDNIYIICPTTSQPVKTGFRAPKGTNIAALSKITLQHCPSCGKGHIWSANAAFWDNETTQIPSLRETVRRIWRGRGASSM